LNDRNLLSQNRFETNEDIDAYVATFSTGEREGLAAADVAILLNRA
jgi:hypothetical protein